MSRSVPVDDLRPFELLALAGTGVVASILLGVGCNSVNWSISSRYYDTFCSHLWPALTPIHAALAQGTLEGFAFGVFYAIAFMMGAGIITGGRCPYVFGLRHLIGILLGACLCWLMGGFAAMALAETSPDFYRAVVFGVPDDRREMLAYAFVGGSISGVQVGGLLSVGIGLIVLRANWRRACPYG